jgi:hypothetical protein
MRISKLVSRPINSPFSINSRSGTRSLNLVLHIRKAAVHGFRSRLELLINTLETAVHGFSRCLELLIDMLKPALHRLDDASLACGEAGQKVLLFAEIGSQFPQNGEHQCVIRFGHNGVLAGP